MQQERERSWAHRGQWRVHSASQPWVPQDRCFKHSEGDKHSHGLHLVTLVSLTFNSPPALGSVGQEKKEFHQWTYTNPTLCSRWLRWLQPPAHCADLCPSGYWPDYLPSLDMSSCHHPAGIMDDLCCRNGRAQEAWIPDQVQPHTAQGCTFFFQLPPFSLFYSSFFPIFLSFPSNYLLLKFQSPFLRVLHWAMIALLYQIPAFFSSLSGFSFMHNIYNFAKAYTFPLLFSDSSP